MPTSSQFLGTCMQCKAFCCIGIRLPVTEKEKYDISAAGFKDCFKLVENGIYDVKLDENDRCPYLKLDYSCEIQSVKPTLCRIWPVVPYYKNNKRGYIIMKCPLFSHLSEENIQQAKKEADTIPLAIVKHLWDIPSEMKQKFKTLEYEEI